jgi:hypothetical protein
MDGLKQFRLVQVVHRSTATNSITARTPAPARADRKSAEGGGEAAEIAGVYLAASGW